LLLIVKVLEIFPSHKKDRIKRTTLYQDLEKGGIRMTDADLMDTPTPDRG